MKNAVFWELRRVPLLKIEVSEECRAPHHRGDKLHRMRRLLVTANIVPCSSLLATLMMVALRSSETSVLTTAARRNFLDDDILHSHRRQNIKSYKALTGWTL
jgi:hypothetical protein